LFRIKYSGYRGQPGIAVLMTLLLLLYCAGAYAEATTVRLQLRWYHQFQFAGYYMAQEQGYYQQAGLQVAIIPGSPDVTALDQVLSGKAQFAVSASGAMLAYMQGQPIVALAAIFQKSPSVWLVRADSDIFTLQDLATRRLELTLSQENTELLAVFAKEGIDINQLKLTHSSMKLENLLSGKTDAFNAYLSNEPYQLEQLGVPYRLIQPIEYGVNFYQDILISHADWIKQNPATAEAFVKASLAGWRFALEHMDYSIEYIQRHYAPDKSLQHLQYEARVIHSLVMPELVELGHMNPGRWQQIADMYQKLGMLEQQRPLNAFLYTAPAPADYKLLFKSVLLMLLIVGVLSFLTLRFRRLASALQEEIGRHAETERLLVQRNQELLQLASIDILTGLVNRRVIMQQAQSEIRRANRYQKDLAVLMLDIDHFKQINDRYGHAAGDRVLAEFAELCKQSIRDTDLAGRYGGEEFFILLPEIDIKTAILSAERLRMCIAAHQFTLRDGTTLSITCSIGIASYLPDQDDLDKLLLRADQAMYQAKHQGRNRCCVQH
jgi:diguanylate cyclase (GGDEF)-like protein